MTELTTTSPVFVETLFTGQPMTAHEEVACPVCQGLTNVRFSAYFDSYNGGRYVHLACLSPQRINEYDVVRAASVYKSMVDSGQFSPVELTLHRQTVIKHTIRPDSL